MTEVIPLTSDQQAIIDEWHNRIRRRLYPQMTDPAWIYLRFRGGARGVLTEQWIEMICRTAIHNEGRALLKPAVQVLMEKALGIPIMLFREQLNVDGWSAYGSTTTTWIGNTWLDVDLTMTSSASALAANEWPPLVIAHTVVPDFGSVVPDAVYPWLGFKGGTLETVAHDPPPPLTLDTISFILERGGTLTAQLSAQGGTAPYTYEKVSGFAFVAVSETGEVNIGLMADATITGLRSFIARVTDSVGASVEATLTITIGS